MARIVKHVSWIACALALVGAGVALVPPLWRWRVRRSTAKRQREYLEAQWPEFHKLAATFAGFFASNGVNTPFSIGVQIHPQAPEFSEQMSFLNAFTDYVERATRLTPRSVEEARELAQGLESAVHIFEGRGGLTALRQLELAGPLSAGARNSRALGAPFDARIWRVGESRAPDGARSE